MKYFIEIGSCDFDTNIDLITTGSWKGVMCEPAELYRNNLETLVKDNRYRSNLEILPYAISDYDGEILFGEAQDSSEGSRSLGSWRRGISSILEENHKGERLFDLANNKQFLAKEYRVPCWTLDTLIKFTGYKHIDYLKIDTEGHEMNILENYSWNIKPSLIKLEHSHIDDLYAKNFLEALGYMVYVEESDIYALR